MTGSMGLHVQPYGRRTEPTHPGNLDFVVVTNEDLGFNNSLVTTTNDTFETTIPYPQEWDVDRNVVVLRKVQFILETQKHFEEGGMENLAVYMSYLDRSPTATYRGGLADTNDEWFKSTFAGPMMFGDMIEQPLASAAVEVYFLPGNRNVIAEYIPEIPLSMFFPIYLDFVNNSATGTLATGADTAASFTLFERVTLRYFYTIRSMNQAERDLMSALAGAPVRWAQLGS